MATISRTERECRRKKLITQKTALPTRLVSDIFREGEDVTGTCKSGQGTCQKVWADNGPQYWSIR